MGQKAQLKRTDSDFQDFDVFIYGVRQDLSRVVSADAVKGEVWRYQIDAGGEIPPPLELATGTVTIKPKKKQATGASEPPTATSEQRPAQARPTARKGR
ncbi:MAG: hypothetical protein WD871_01900 [Xanthobacteraceae bacterium]